MLTREKNYKAITGNGYRFVPKGRTFPTETIRLVLRSISPNLPQMGQFFYDDMLMPLHDRMHAKFQEFQTSFGFTRI